MFQDQGILRTTENAETMTNAARYVWSDRKHYYDTGGTDGMDGIVYSDRTPQVDYWQVRKVYSPVQIRERTLPTEPGQQTLTVHAENRHDFLSLAGMKLEWTLRRNGTALQAGTLPLTAKARETETLSLKLLIPAQPERDVLMLEARCLDEAGRQFYERTIRLNPPNCDRWNLVRAELSANQPNLKVSEGSIQVSHPRFRLEIERQTGRLSISSPDGKPIVENLGPHTGRKLTAAEEVRSVRTTPVWRGDLLSEAKELQTSARKIAEGIEVTVGGKYPRPGVPGQFVAGQYQLLVTASGSIEVSYNYAPVSAADTFVEAGLALAVRAQDSGFRWLGPGPFPGYPGKDCLNEFGIHHLASGDIRFQGNRRGVELAILAAPGGEGILVSGQQMDVAVENTPAGIILAHNALVAGRGNKGMEPETVLKAAEIREISGNFTLLPLTAPWPASLTRWFGPANRTCEVSKPFYRSYDQ